jgi:choline dehydrogenase-like flavoprotein
MPAVTAGEALTGISGVVALAYSRWARSRLHIPRGTPVSLQMDMEQSPDWNNAVSLGSETDRYGRPNAEIRWRISERDLDSLSDMAARLMSNWSKKSAALPSLKSVSRKDEGSKPNDAYHPVGTCRLGEDREAVVDPGLRVRGTGNLFVLSTAIFASAGTANPTFSLFCFAERLGEQLRREIEL